MDVAVNDVAEQLLDYGISKLKMDDENDGQNNNSVASSVNSESPPIRKIFVANLIHAKCHYYLRKLFSNYGQVVDVYVPEKRFKHAKIMFGFVTFQHPEDASRVLKLKPGKLRFHSRKLYVAPADSWHQPIELPDGTVLWKSDSHGGLKHHQHRCGRMVVSREPQSRDQASASPESECATDDAKEIGAVGGHSLTSQTSSSVRGEHKEEGETENDEERGVEEGECKIDILSNDCLIHIFSFLDIIERIKMERVCKRWQMVCLDMWVCQKHLEFASVFSRRRTSLNLPILEAYLKRCGRNLHSLDLSHRYLDAPVIQTIAAVCKNLRYLNLSGFQLTSADLRSLSTSSHKLIALNLDECSGIFEKALKDVFVHSPHLESVTLSGISTPHKHPLTGKCLFGLSRTTLKDLVLDRCEGLRSRNLVKGLRKLKGLERLSLNFYADLTSKDMAGIVRALPKLHSLSMVGHFPLLTSTTLEPLAQLCDLISLSLQLNPAVNNQIMDAITRSCHKIEELNITGCGLHVTDVSLWHLRKLPNLVNLRISYLREVSDVGLVIIANQGKLRKLECQGCPSFTDVGCMRVVTLCNELEHFDFSGCYKVSNDTVQAALDSVKLRTNNIKLTLIVGGTMVRKPDSFKKNPLLEVDFSNLCDAELRPDFVDDIYFPSSDNEDYDYVDDLCDWGSGYGGGHQPCLCDDSLMCPMHDMD